MSNYIEEAEIAGMSFGIEDHASPGKHFFNGAEYKKDKSKRFQMWTGGCGIGYAKTINDARKELLAYVVMQLRERIVKAQLEINECDAAIRQIEQYQSGALSLLNGKESRP